jgi:phage shock protein PspC (stress-responsive transcriptional regulator)
MNKVTTINLNGKAYQVEEAGYDLLRKYLDQAAAKLEGNPDKDEIMGDFEHAIAEKCEHYLSGGKDVITASEIEAIIAKMGPVQTEAEHNDTADNASSSSQSQNASGGAHPPRRLYRVVEREWIAGVCNGLGAYFNLDTVLIRILFVVLALLTHGIMIVIYIILAFVMPVARTEEERERARGQAPFTANDFIEQSKQRYAEFQKNHPHMPATPADPLDKNEWRKWKQEMKQQKYEWRSDRHAEKARRRAERVSARHEAYGGGFVRFILGLVIVALVVVWAMVLWSILLHGLAFAYPIVALIATGSGFAAHHPMVLAIAFITALLYVLTLPLKLLMKNARPQHWGHYSFFNDIVQSVFFIFALYLLLYIGGILFPAVHEGWSMLFMSLKSI